MISRVLLGVRGMNEESGIRIADFLKQQKGIISAIPDIEQIEVHYDSSIYTVMDLVRLVRSQGFLAGML